MDWQKNRVLILWPVEEEKLRQGNKNQPVNGREWQTNRLSSGKTLSWKIQLKSQNKAG